MNRSLLAALSIALVASAAQAPAAPPAGADRTAALPPGSRVEVDVIMAGAPERALWRPGVVTAIESGEYVIRLDEGREYRLPIRPDRHWLRPLKEGGPRATADTSAPGSAGPAAASEPAAEADEAPPRPVAGSRVEVDVIMAGAPERGVWRAGVVARIEDGNYVVRLDEGREYSLPIRPDKEWIRTTAEPEVPPEPTTPPTAPPPTHAATPARKAPARPIAPAEPPAPAPVSRSAAPPASPAAPAAAPAPVPAATGRGAPPDGVYTCQKIGQTYMGLGALEIRGSSYRGMTEPGTGRFRPFTVAADGGIAWSAGLEGMPDGWTLLSSVLAGPDHLARPFIQIHYRSKSGFNDAIDCVRE